MGLWGGAHGLSSHLDESIFKMNLIESPSPPLPPRLESFQAFPLTPAMKQTSLLYCQSFPGNAVWFSLGQLRGKPYVYHSHTKSDGYICLSVHAIFARLNLSFSQRVGIRDRAKMSEWVGGMCWGALT